MKVIIFLGPPGVGKGTQCHLLSERLGVKHISTGEVIRREISSKSALGLRVKEIVEGGNLVDDATAFQCLESTFNSLDIKKSDFVLLDGIPRNLVQAKMMEQFLEKFGAKVDSVISLNSELSELYQRFANRWTCSSCGYIASIANAEDVPHFQCNKCGKTGTMFRRKDDDAVKKRFDVYQNETLPLIAYYAERKILNAVDGLESIELVYAKIVSNLLKIKG